MQNISVQIPCNISQKTERHPDMKHQTPHAFYINPVEIDLIGAGATGSQILAGLTRLHLAMIELGHPAGLKVCCWDPDSVTHANIGRQLFLENEIGCNKAITLINRYNFHFALEWIAIPERFQTRYSNDKNKIIISAVDTRKSRAEIRQAMKNYPNAYYIESGCGLDFGQIYCGNGSPDLPYPWKNHPELYDATLDEPYHSSCSAADSLEHHGLFINQFIATGVLEFIWQLFRNGGLTYSELYFNLKTGRMLSKTIEAPKKKKRR